MKPLASLSLDLDNQWSYMKTHGDEGWEAFPSYFERLVPPVLDLLGERDLRITFFVVGQDAELQKNHAPLRQLVDAGHEIGSHSFHHEPWLHLYSEEQVAEELERAEQAIERATGRRPDGFRGPGFSFSPTVLEVLHNRGYRFDASTFPTYVGPLARAYYFWTSDLTDEEKQKRKTLFGSWRHGLRPLKPYRWRLPSGAHLLELPVTTMPIFKLPFHLSYVLYLSTFSKHLARSYWRNSLRLCRLMRVEPSVLMHPLDFLGGDEVQELDFFPAMQMKGEEKRRHVAGYLDDLAQRFRILPMGRYADQAQDRRGMRTRAASGSNGS